MSTVSCGEPTSRASHLLVGRIGGQEIPLPKALGTGPIVSTFQSPGGEVYEHPGGPSPKGGPDKPMIATSHGEESPIVGEAIQPPPALDERKSKKFIHTVTNKLKQKLGATTSEVPVWQLYGE